MAQSDQVVQNATFPSVRADINDNLAALFSQSSGNSAPSVTVAFQPWVDSSSDPPVWKVRNGSNSAWITVGVLDPAGFNAGGITAIANGGTGATTAAAAILALLPSQAGNAGKALAAEMEASGIEAVTAQEMEQALAMAASVRSNSTVSSLLSNGAAETSHWWDDVATGMRCKCRPDWLSADGETIVDLKTCQDASAASFAKSVAQWSYQVQAAHYLCGTLAKRFVFVAVEKILPYAVGVYELDAEAMVHGSVLRHTSLQRIQDCRAINSYPGYTDGIQTLHLPGWALKTNSTFTSEDF